MCAKKTADELFAPGEAAPSFRLIDRNDRMVSLSDFSGKYLVLYFYPKDNTSGCTLEAKDFSCNLDKFRSLNCEVVGVSPDSPLSHRGFSNKHNLQIALLSDENKEIVNLYKSWGRKVLYGKAHEGVIRSTFLISPEGKFIKSWTKVRVDGHVNEVLAALKEAQKS